MHKSELPAEPDLAVPPIPVICDRCREAGTAGDGTFSAITDILGFTPVPRRAHVNGWTEEHQRAFIAALAFTGSPKQAARAIGKHQFGAERLRKHRAGKGFADAWDAAMDLAREREAYRVHDNLAGLATQCEARQGKWTLGSDPAAEPGDHDGIHPDCDYDPDVHTDDYPEHWQAMRNIRDRLLAARRMLLFLIHLEEDKRRAWEVLVGPVDWDRAERLEAQDDEPVPGGTMNRHGLPNMTRADMVLTVEAGLLPELTGGRDTMAEVMRLAAELEADGETPGED